MTKYPHPSASRFGTIHLVLPVRALLDLLNEFGRTNLARPVTTPFGLRPQVQTFHQVVWALGDWILEVAVELRWSDQVFKVIASSPCPV